MASSLTALDRSRSTGEHRSLIQKLNGPWHERGNQVFGVIVLVHWAEHLVQAYQVFVLGWPRTSSRGLVGTWVPWMATAETMHYAYALVMLVGIWILRSGFVGRSRTWWMIAFWIQFWHHIEHALLQGQAIVGKNLFGSPVPTSIVQQWIPRIELHLFYNAIVFVPMVIAMYLHLFPTAEEQRHQACTCARTPRPQSAS